MYSQIGRASCTSLTAVAVLVVRSAANDVARVDGAGDKGYVNFNGGDGH